MQHQWNDKIFSSAATGFEKLALEIFAFQYGHNPLYKAYADLLKLSPSNVRSLNEIPFLPIHFFKTHAVRTGEFMPEAIFESSGTTSTGNSYHHVKDLSLYRQSFMRSFEIFLGKVSGYCIIGLLPSYLERKNSSLIYMVDELIRQSKISETGFYLDQFEKLHDVLQTLEHKEQKTLLIGVGFALLDFAEN